MVYCFLSSLDLKPSQTENLSWYLNIELVSILSSWSSVCHTLYLFSYSEFASNYLVWCVLPPLKLHLQVVQWHSGFLISSTRAGWNLLFKLCRSFTLCRLIPIHASVFFTLGCLSISCGLLVSTRQGSGPGARGGLTRGWDRRGLYLTDTPCLLPALLQSIQVGWSQGGCHNVGSLWGRDYPIRKWKSKATAGSLVFDIWKQPKCSAKICLKTESAGWD